MRKLDMKRGSYQKYPFKKNQKIDGTTILQDEFILYQNRYQVEFLCRCGKTDYKRLDYFNKMKYKCCKYCSRQNNYPEQRISKRNFKEGIHEKWLTSINSNLNRKNKLIKCNITLKDLKNQLVKQNNKCIYTGIELNVLNIFKQDSNASIDRKDSDKDYTVNNIQWVYKPVNIMKNDFSEKDFIDICKKVANFT